MTAAAAVSPLRPPAAPPPSPPLKPLPAGQSREGRRRGGHSCLGGLTSCFCRGSPVAASDAGHPDVDRRGRRSPSWFSWSRKKNKKTVAPVDAPAGVDPAPAGRGEKAAAGEGADVQNKEEEKKEGELHPRRTAPPTATSPAKKPPPPAAKESLGQRLFQKLLKGNKDKSGTRPPITGSHPDEVSKPDRRRRRQPPPPQWQIRLASLSPKYDSRGGSPARTTAAGAVAGAIWAPSSSVDSPGTHYSTSTASPHGGAAAAPSRLGFRRSQKTTADLDPPPPSPHARGRNDRLLGMSVMAVVLAMVVFFGRVSAVLFTCVWLYCLPRMRATMAEPLRGGGSAGAGVDLDSGEYKKKVVLEGLLQRDGRRSPGSAARTDR